MLVAVAVFAGILLFGVVVGFGSLAVRWLRLPADPPEAVVYEPPSPEPVAPGDREAARMRAAAWLVAAEQGNRAHTVLISARGSADVAEWIASCTADRADAARAAAGQAMAAAEQARAAFAAGDGAALAAAELAASTAASRIAALTEGLPDWRVAERRKLLLLSAALAASLALAAVATWLR
jgi:hypothetical protein